MWPAVSEQRLRLSDETEDVRRADLATIVADVHAEIGGRIVDEPNAAPVFIERELRPYGFEPVAEARLGEQVFPQVCQPDPPTFGVQREALAAELYRAGDEVAIRRAPVLVPERVVPDVVHAAEHEVAFPVNLAVQVYAQALRGQIIQERFERVETLPFFVPHHAMSGGKRRLTNWLIGVRQIEQDQAVAPIRRVEDLDSAALTYAEVKAIASGNPLVIEKAQVDAELMRLTRLRSAHAEEQYRIRSNLRHAHDDAATFTARLDNLPQDIAAREDTSGDKFTIVLDGETVTNRGIARELLIRRAEKLKNRVCEEVLVGKFAGFDLFVRTDLGGDADLVLRGKNSYAARVTDTAPGTIRSLEATVQGFEERATKLETDIAASQKRAKELEGKVGAPFECEARYQELSRRQDQIEEQLDLTKNQAPSQAESPSDDATEEATEKQSTTKAIRPARRSTIRV